VCQAEPKPLLATECDRGFSLLPRVRRFTAELIQGGSEAVGEGQATGLCQSLGERVLAGSDPDSLELFFHHADHLGSGPVLTRDDGDLLGQEEYFPYGRASDRREARDRYRFIGVEQDEDTRLCMTGPRLYDPICGRFCQPDPVAVTRFDSSPYVYASAAPTHRSDPGGYADGNTFDWGILPSPGAPPPEGIRPNAETTFDRNDLPTPTLPLRESSAPPPAPVRPPEPCYSFPITEVDVGPYVLDEEAANFRERINSARGRAWLGYFGNDEHWARIYGEMDAVEAREAESIIEGVETLGLRDTPIGQRATEIANNNLQGIALTNAARVVAARGGSLISGGLDERPIRGCGRL
jgi:RHS repeat-associated protein